MVRRAAEVPPWVSLNPTSDAPYYRQLYEGVRSAILSGLLPVGTRLPSTRTLATELGVSRTTAVTAFDQLLAEGYLEGKVGSGTFVAGSLPDDLLSVRERVECESGPARSGRRLSGRGAMLAATPATAVRDRGSPRAFRPGVPALDEFPYAVWRRISGKVWRRPSGGLLGYGDPAGYWPLREAISGHLRTARGVRCLPEQVIVVSGSQQALDLAARVLLDPGDAVWVEDPGYTGARGALSGAGARLVPVPVDGEGLEVEKGIEREPDARLACVTPSHQYPLGVTMNLGRRLVLLGWAGSSGAWVVEDDYDSEYRYTGRPLEALQGLDTGERVLYVGTFSKVLFPALRLGYLVVPPDLIEAFTSARELTDRHPPT
ncbi:MAG: PLP-dependent aminotransferase family protein, partial [Rubrobacter sp.]